MSRSLIRKNQLKYSQSNDSLVWIINIIKEKLHNQIAILSALISEENPLFSSADKTTKLILKNSSSLDQLGDLPKEKAAASIRGLEGTATRHYFSILSQLVPEQYYFSGRSQHPAKDMFNCLLNYGYGILYAKIEAALIRAGIDPYLGFFHRDEYNKPVLVYDVIEKFRIWVEYVVIDLCLQEVIFIEFFKVESGIFWLEQEGKQILITALNDYLAEVVLIKKRSFSRMEHINEFCRSFASALKSFKNK